MQPGNIRMCLTYNDTYYWRPILFFLHNEGYGSQEMKNKVLNLTIAYYSSVVVLP